jgi:hypothetical protein
MTKFRDGGGGEPHAHDVLLQFCSDAWLHRAQSVLSELVTKAGADLSGVSFSGCEVFTDPPANLRIEGTNRTYWYFRIGEGFAFASREDREDVDFRVVVDYQTALPRARTLHAQAPARTSDDRTRSGLPYALALLFFELHNRLAVVTA